MPQVTATYVIGHANPDTDAIASAMGYAWLISQRAEAGVEAPVAARAGALNVQTAWIFNRLGIDAPILLRDVAPHFDVLARPLDSVDPDAPLSEAWAIARRSGAVAPVVDAEGKPFGLVTGASVFSLLGEWVGPDGEGHGAVTLAEVFATPCRAIADTDVPAFSAASRVRDGLRHVLPGERDYFFVVDDAGCYAGICRKRDLLDPPRVQLILVDHNEVGQAVFGADEAVLLEVLDHHRLDNPPTRLPIRFRADPVGSTCTLVAEGIEERGLRPPPEIAGLLLAGVLSDTLVFRSPTATARDERVAARLLRWATTPGAPLAGETIESFGAALLAAGADLANRAPEDVVSADLKRYEGGGLVFGVAQAEVTDLAVLDAQLASLQEALDVLRGRRGFDFAALLVTDVVRGGSRLVMSDAPPALDVLPYERRADGTLDACGVVSRKKQLLPVILSALEG